MDGAGEHPLFRRQSSKRTYSTMASNHREPAPDTSSSSLFIPHDEHYDTEQVSRRTRLALPSMRTTPAHFPGDGLDFRRPVMSGVTSAAVAPVIDLTDEDTPQPAGGQARNSHSAQATAGPSRASRLPNFGGRNIIDLPGAFGEGDAHQQQQPAYNPYLRQHTAVMDRPQFAQLRRPARFRQHSPAIPASVIADLDAEDEEDDFFEVVSERTLSRPQTASRQPTPALPVQRSITPYPADLRPQQPIDLTGDDDVVFMRATHREGHGVNAAAPGTTAGVGTRSVAPPDNGFGMGRIAEMLGGQGRLLERLGFQRYVGYPEPDEQLDPFADLGPPRRHQHRAPRAHTPHAAGGLHFGGPVHVGHGLPTMMDYGAPGFDMGYVGANRPPSPKYEPPAEVDEGFTRNPGEDDVVVCPNCGDELAISEDEVKQQVWVVKRCGHAYCGTCAVNRGKGGKSKKGKGKAGDAHVGVGPDGLPLPAPFSKCVVEGCGETISSKSGMVHVFLGS